MNKKAKSFKSYLEKNKIESYQIDELKDDRATAIFRSNIELNGQMIPFGLIFDETIYSMFQILLAPKATEVADKAKLLEYINKQNRMLKPFKYSLDDTGSVLLEVSMIDPKDEVDGELVYVMLEVIYKHLQETYADLMKLIWG